MPPVDGKQQLSTWLDEEDAERVRAAAAADHRTVSSWIKLVVLAKLAEDAEVAA